MIFLAPTTSAAAALRIIYQGWRCTWSYSCITCFGASLLLRGWVSELDLGLRQLNWDRTLLVTAGVPAVASLAALPFLPFAWHPTECLLEPGAKIVTSCIEVQPSRLL